MPISRDRAVAIFTKLGAKDPAFWADKEIVANKPFLARFLFMTGLWRCAIREDESWMRSWGSDEAAPIPSAIARMLEKGIDPSDLTDVVRDMQVQALFNVCCLIDEPSGAVGDLLNDIAENVEWGLADLDPKTGDLGRQIEDVHESFHSFDPAGRNGEPRDRSQGASKKKKRPVKPATKK
jgi:hypothetical protein